MRKKKPAEGPHRSQDLNHAPRPEVGYPPLRPSVEILNYECVKNNSEGERYWPTQAPYKRRSQDGSAQARLENAYPE